MSQKTKKVVGSLVGVDSNIFSLGGHFSRLAKKQGWSADDIEAVLAQVKECNSYDDAVSVLLCNMQEAESSEDGTNEHDSADAPVISPYGQACAYVSRYPYSDSAVGMAKLIMSLFDNSPFGYRECITAFGKANLELALRVIQHFHAVGEDEELCEVGRKVVELLPRLHKAGQASSSAFYKYLEESKQQQDGEE